MSLYLTDFINQINFKMKLEDLDESIIEEIEYFNNQLVSGEVQIALNLIVVTYSDRLPRNELPFLKWVIDSLDVVDKDYFYAMLQLKQTWLDKTLSAEERDALVSRLLNTDWKFKYDFLARHFYGKLIGYGCFPSSREMALAIRDKIAQIKFDPYLN